MHGAPPGSASLAQLAERCAAAATEVAAGGGSLGRLTAAADELDAALGRAGGPGAASPVVRGTRDAAGDLLVALCAAGLDGAERRVLADALARLLQEVAREVAPEVDREASRVVPAGWGREQDPSQVPWQVTGGSAH